jgi:hypothetical protein
MHAMTDLGLSREARVFVTVVIVFDFFFFSVVGIKTRASLLTRQAL